MNDIKKIIKLDYFSIRPYFTIKNMVIFVGLSIFYSYLAKNPTATFSMPILFTLIFSGYPFLVGDEAGIDSLYRVFGIKRENVVYGRYIFTFLLSAFCVIVGVGLYIITSLIFKYNAEINGFKNYIFVSFFIILFVVAIQYPLYFKYGYTKAKTLAIIPFILFAILVSLLSYFKEGIMGIIMKIDNYNTIYITIVAFILVMLVSFVSIIISKKIYRKRDF